METIGFSCSSGAFYDNMLPANTREKLQANSHKEGRGSGSREGEIQDSSTVVFCVKLDCLFISYKEV